jgi:predicted house-cleaning noncanonical NTP pyrophosphatase (MazG superfamily)
MPKNHNKLVRDKIPAIIAGKGGSAVTRTLDDPEYLQALIAKLAEECAEFTEAVNLEELADVQEVVLALADALATRTELEQTRAAKVEARGAFTQKIFLESTD